MPRGLIYFVELAAGPTAELLARPDVCQPLAQSGAGVAMAMLDLAPERAEAVRALRKLGIPVTAWLVLEPEAGYWLTADNADAAAERYAQVRAWALAEDLDFATIGLDIEMPHDDSADLVRDPLRALGRLLWNRRPHGRLGEAHSRYEALVARIRGDGYDVETYQFPFLHDERRAGSHLLQRALGVVDVSADREVLMLYRSVLPAPWGELLIDAYGPGADAIAVGITGGGVAILAPAFENRLLDFDGLVHDLRRARRYTDRLYVFSLEGCVEAGMLPHLCQVDLGPAPAGPARLRHLSAAGRAALRGLLRAHQTLHLWRHRARAGV